MSEVGVHHIDPNDSYGKAIGVLAAVLAVLLSIFTILAHRAHTESIKLQNVTNDMWSHYQGKRIRDYQLNLNIDLIKVMPATANTKSLLISYAQKHTQYTKDLDAIKQAADASVTREIIVQKKALYYDLAEGVLEISLVMSSLYFISHKRLFPKFSLTFGALGILAGIMGLLL